MGVMQQFHIFLRVEGWSARMHIPQGCGAGVGVVQEPGVGAGAGAGVGTAPPRLRTPDIPNRRIHVRPDIYWLLDVNGNRFDLKRVTSVAGCLSTYTCGYRSQGNELYADQSSFR